jgi:hypothetical protein
METEELDARATLMAQAQRTLWEIEPLEDDVRERGRLNPRRSRSGYREPVARRDAAAGKGVERPAVDVDAFVAEVREEMVHEKLAEAEQAAWEGRINAVLDPAPVRVGGRMRPVTGSVLRDHEW